MLTEIERAALNDVLDRRHSLWNAIEDAGYEDEAVSFRRLIACLDRLYPPGHDAEITPERLVACGGRSACEHQDEIQFGSQLDRYVVFDYSVKGDFMWFVNHRCVHPIAAPRNMGEVWQLLERCGIPVTKCGE